MSCYDTKTRFDLLFTWLRTRVSLDMKWPNQVLRTDNQANVVVALTVILLSKHVHMAQEFSKQKKLAHSRLPLYLMIW